MNLLGSIIKKNKNLLHLNLDATGLTEAMICMIGKNMRRAKSLLSIHLSFNSGTLPRAIKTVRQIIHAVDEYTPLHKDFRPYKLLSNYLSD